jgi:hypothetical protein
MRGGHDSFYPDYLPPDPKYGTTAQMADLMKRDVTRWRAVADRIKLTLD